MSRKTDTNAILGKAISEGRQLTDEEQALFYLEFQKEMSPIVDRIRRESIKAHQMAQFFILD